MRLIGEALDASEGEANGANDQAVFAGRFEGVETLARHSLGQAVRRVVTDNELEPFTPHDLRRTGATIAQAARLPVDFIKALLNHSDKGVMASMRAGTCSKRSAKRSSRLKRRCCR